MREARVGESGDTQAAIGFRHGQIYGVAAQSQRRIGVADKWRKHGGAAVRRREFPLQLTRFGIKIPLCIGDEKSIGDGDARLILTEGVVQTLVVIDEHQFALDVSHGGSPLMPVLEAASGVIRNGVVVYRKGRRQGDAAGGDRGIARDGEHHDACGSIRCHAALRPREI